MPQGSAEAPFSQHGNDARIKRDYASKQNHDSDIGASETTAADPLVGVGMAMSGSAGFVVVLSSALDARRD